MRRLTLLTTLTLIWGWQGWLVHPWHPAAALAQDAGAAQSLSERQAAATDAKPNTQEVPDGPTSAQLRASIHRAMADLIEARAAEKPDHEKIQKLVEQLQELRRKLDAQAGTLGSRAPAYGCDGAWQCPWGGPGMGFGRGRRGGPGMGPGVGPGPRAGRGAGAAQGPRPGAAAAGMRPGRGPGRGQGLGGGWGRGAGQQPAAGRGRGYGPGAGFGPGYGRGYGRGWGGFIDENGNGVCDNYERLWGTP